MADEPHTPRSALPLATVVAMAAGSALLLLQLSRPLWFLGDDWSFLLGRRLGDDAWGQLMSPHNEHWSLIPVLEFRSLCTIFGLHYLPYAAVVAACHVAVLLLVFTLLRRNGASDWTSAAATGFLAFAGAAGEDLLWSFQVGFLLPIALGLAALVVLDAGRSAARPSARLALVWILLIGALMSSGVGITMVVWAALVALLADGVRRAVAVTVVPAVVYLAWYVGYGHAAAGQDHGPWQLVPGAVFKGTANIWDKVLPFPNLGGAFVVLLAIAAIWVRVEPRLVGLARAGLVSCSFFFGLVALSRVQMGGTGATVQSRYVYIGLVLTLPALAIGLGWVAERVPVRRSVAAVAILLLVVVPGAAQLKRYQETRLRAIGDLREQVVAAADLARSGQPLLAQQFSASNPDINTAALARPDVVDRLPDVRPRPKVVLDVRSSLQVGTGSAALAVPQDAPDLTYVGGGTSSATGGCLSGVSAGGELRFGSGTDGAQVRLTVSGTKVTTALSDGSRLSRPTKRPVAAGRDVWVATSAVGTQLRISIPDGPFSACEGDRDGS